MNKYHIIYQYISHGSLLSKIQYKSYLIHFSVIGMLHFTLGVTASVRPPYSVCDHSHIVNCYHNKLCVVARDQKDLYSSCYILSYSLLICRMWAELSNLRYGGPFKNNNVMSSCLIETYIFTYLQILKVVLINAVHMEINW